MNAANQLNPSTRWATARISEWLTRRAEELEVEYDKLAQKNKNEVSENKTVLDTIQAVAAEARLNGQALEAYKLARDVLDDGWWEQVTKEWEELQAASEPAAGSTT